MKISKINIDFVEQCTNGNYNVMVSVIVKVHHKETKNEHQDVGCGLVENIPEKSVGVILARRVCCVNNINYLESGG
jgi:recombination DNA repair RAD52 pathway protein